MLATEVPLSGAMRPTAWATNGEFNASISGSVGSFAHEAKERDVGEVGIGLLGCGAVGSAVVRRLASLETPLGVLRRVAVRDVGKARACVLADGVLTDDAFAVVEDPAVHVVVEVMGGTEPAYELVTRALALGKPVVTANKALFGEHGPQLRERARDARVPLLYEAAVAAAVPLIRGLSGLLAADRIVKVEGVLNGTANYVLSRMEQDGIALDEAVAEAQRLGYAEADPTRDLDGTDSADKLALLAQLCFDQPVHSADVQRLGIDWLERHHIDSANERGRHWRLVATATRDRCTRVEPAPLRADHPLARVNGVDNGIIVMTERSGTFTFTGPGAGGDATATAVVADLAAATRWAPVCASAWLSALPA